MMANSNPHHFQQQVYLQHPLGRVLAAHFRHADSKHSEDKKEYRNNGIASKIVMRKERKIDSASTHTNQQCQ